MMGGWQHEYLMSYAEITWDCGGDKIPQKGME